MQEDFEIIEQLRHVHREVVRLNEGYVAMSAIVADLTVAVASLQASDARVKARVAALAASLQLQIDTLKNHPVVAGSDDSDLSDLLNRITATTSDLDSIASAPSGTITPGTSVVPPTPIDSSGVTPLNTSSNSSVPPADGTVGIAGTTVTTQTSGGVLAPDDPTAGPSQGVSSPTLGVGNAGATAGGSVPASANMPTSSGVTSAPANTAQPVALNSGGSGASPQTPAQADAASPTPGVASVGGGQVTGTANSVDASAVADPEKAKSDAARAADPTDEGDTAKSVPLDPNDPFASGRSVYVFRGTGTPNPDEWPTAGTVNGTTVYFYKGDAVPGDRNGDGLGGVWSLAAKPLAS